jgi:hypothetical protein
MFGAQITAAMNLLKEIHHELTKIRWELEIARIHREEKDLADVR